MSSLEEYSPQIGPDSKPELKSEQKGPLLLPYTEIVNLPDGIGFGPASTEAQELGTHHTLSKVIRRLAEQDQQQSIRLAGLNLRSSDQRIPGQIFPGLANYSSYSKIVVNLLLQEYPNLCWMRGDNIELNQAGRVKLGWAPGAMKDGIIGDIRTVNYAYKNYRGEQRQRPGLIVVKLEDIKIAALDHIIRIGSHHEYDTSIHPRGSKSDQYQEWVADSVKVFALPTSEKREEVEQLLAAKAI